MMPGIQTRARYSGAMIKFEAARLTSRKGNCVIVIVRPAILHSEENVQKVRRIIEPQFPRNEVVLMAQNNLRPNFHGPDEIVRHLGKLNITHLPWRKYILNGLDDLSEYAWFDDVRIANIGTYTGVKLGVEARDIALVVFFLISAWLLL